MLKEMFYASGSLAGVFNSPKTEAEFQCSPFYGVLVASVYDDDLNPRFIKQFEEQYVFFMAITPDRVIAFKLVKSLEEAEAEASEGQAIFFDSTGLGRNLDYVKGDLFPWLVSSNKAKDPFLAYIER